MSKKSPERRGDSIIALSDAFLVSQMLLVTPWAPTRPLIHRSLKFCEQLSKCYTVQKTPIFYYFPGKSKERG